MEPPAILRSLLGLGHPEGDYRFQGGTECAVHRTIAFAPYADLLWKTLILAQAKKFSEDVRSAIPGQWLAYNLSPVEIELSWIVCAAGQGGRSIVARMGIKTRFC